MKYYLKKLGSQELGSVGVDGKAKRGRYIYISKDDSVLELFPPLSTTISNDSSLIPIIPLYHEVKQKVYCNFIYHNDKFTRPKGTRNEYRIYSNGSLEGNNLKFKPGDIAIFKKDTVVLDGEEQTVYFMDLLENKDTAFYKQCLRVISYSKIRGEGHAVFDGVLAEVEEKIKRVVDSGLEETIIDKTVTDRVPNNTSGMESLFNASTFHDFVMVGYDNKCAITRSVIRYENYMNLEAAHIKPKSHGGLFLPNNGMALTRDLHWAFDKGFYTLDDDLRVRVHPQTSSEFLSSLNGKKIFIPENSFFVPDLDNVHYHQENVYGLFLTTGRL